MSRSKTAVLFGALVVLATLFLAAWTGVAQAMVLERVSLSGSGGQANGSSGSPAISADGRYVAFVSSGTGLVPGDTSTYWGVFVKDRDTGAIELVSVSTEGVEANYWSQRPAISADGRYVAFESRADNLVSGDTNDYPDIFVHDRQTGVTERVSVATGGAQATGWSSFASISADGRYVAFESGAGDLVPNDTNQEWDVFVHDRQTGSTERVSVSSAGGQGSGASWRPAISADGGYVAFRSYAPDLVLGAGAAAAQAYMSTGIFVRDLAGGVTTELILPWGREEQLDVSQVRPSISADGRRVAFGGWMYRAGALSDALPVVYVVDRVSGSSDSFASGGRYYEESVGRTGLFDTALSADGRFVGYVSIQAGRNDVGVYDGQTRSAHTLSLASGLAANGSSAYPSASADGGLIAFASDASNLVGGDTNGVADVFVATNRTDPVVVRSIRGTDRYDTAIRLSQSAFPGQLPAGAGLVLAPGETFAEALCGAPLAAAMGGPVLLTPTVGLNNAVKAEIQRLKPARVILVGLSDTVKNAVQTALGSGGTATAIRGASVYEMSYKVAVKLAETMGSLAGATAIVTRGDLFPDALGVAPLACAMKWPILLTGAGDTLNTYAAQALNDLTIATALKAGTYVTLPASTVGVGNLSGANRYETNRNVAVWSKTNAGLTYAHLGVTTGDKFPDALSAGPYLAKDRGIVLLSPLYGPVPPVISAEITANAAAMQKVTFIACLESVMNQVRSLVF